MNTDIKFENCHVMLGDCLSRMKEIPDDSIDLTVTSPPYDNLRTYKGYSFDFEGIAKELYRITKEGGVVVWNVSDATVNGSETLTSFRQALYFKDVCGFSVHDTMIYEKSGFSNPSVNRYHQVFEYMFVLTKGIVGTFNPLKDRPNKYVGEMGRNNVGKKCKRDNLGMRYNIWRFANGKNQTAKWNDSAFKHPAPFPEALANDHIISWSNEGDAVFDPFTGSGTTAKMSLLNSRKFIGCEIAEEYMDIISERLREFYNH